MAYIKDLLLQPIPSIRNTRLDTLEDSFISKCEALRTTLFIMLRRITSTKVITSIKSR